MAPASSSPMSNHADRVDANNKSYKIDKTTRRVPMRAVSASEKFVYITDDGLAADDPSAIIFYPTL